MVKELKLVKVWSNLVFKLKQKKKTIRLRIRLRARGYVLRVLRLHLKTRGGDAGSPTVGPGGPLVRFD